MVRVFSCPECLTIAATTTFDPEAARARRLQDSTIYLTDYKRTFAGNPDHFPLVDEVLEVLIERQETRMSGKSKLKSGPKVS